MLLNIGAVLWLLACHYASLYNPEGKPSLVSLLSFTSFFAYLLNLFFIVFWLFSKRKMLLFLSLLALAVSYSFVKPIIGFNYFGNNKIKPNDGGLKIMTWNVHLFDLGEWTNDETSKAKIIQLISEENPDILCLEEFYWDDNQNMEPYTSIIQQLGYPYVKLSSNFEMKKRRITMNSTPNEIIHTGDAIFSKYPLQNETSYILKENYKMLSVDVVMDSNSTFNLNVVHLTSVGFGGKEMEFIEDVKSKGVNKEKQQQSISLLRKLRNASADRAVLANRIDSIKRFTDHPIILCGDFNDVPGSYVYRKVKGDLADAFEKKGVGFGRTYRNIFPTLRIDYILFDDQALKAEGYIKRDVDLSDHFPVIANFSIRAK